MSSFLEALKSRCEVVELDGGRDWRQGTQSEGEVGLEQRQSWMTMDDGEFEVAWQLAVGSEAAAGE